MFDEGGEACELQRETRGSGCSPQARSRGSGMNIYNIS